MISESTPDTAEAEVTGVAVMAAVETTAVAAITAAEDMEAVETTAVVDTVVMAPAITTARIRFITAAALLGRTGRMARSVIQFTAGTGVTSLR